VSPTCKGRSRGRHERRSHRDRIGRGEELRPDLALFLRSLGSIQLPEPFSQLSARRR
jgi:hypothetical protein